MNQKKIWTDKLVPFDYETALMVENLTEKPCDILNGGSHYFFTADYSQHTDPDYVNAIINAIDGRLGKRIIDITDDADQKKIIVKVHFSQENLPQIFQFEDSEPLLEAGTKYCKEVVWALQVHGTVEIAKRLAAFCGGGSMEIPKEGDAIFYFVDKISGVWKCAKEGEYIIHIPNKPYQILTEEKFSQEWICK